MYRFIYFLLIAVLFTNCKNEKNATKNVEVVMQDTIVDSHFSQNEIQAKFMSHLSVNNGKEKNLNYKLTFEKQVLIDVIYWGYDAKIHKGQLICNQTVAKELKTIFEELYEIKFPIFNVKPISEFDFDDDLSMRSNNTTCFNYRMKTLQNGWSKHAEGLAIDINPLQNPFVTTDKTYPQNSNQNQELGRLSMSDQEALKVMAIFRKYNWKWGGNWKKNKDYMHWEK